MGGIAQGSDPGANRFVAPIDMRATPGRATTHLRPSRSWCREPAFGGRQTTAQLWATVIAVCLGLFTAQSGCANDTKSAPGDAAASIADANVVVPFDAQQPPDAIQHDARPVRQGSHCDVPLLLGPTDQQAGDTSLFPDVASAGCSPGASVSPDTIYLVSLGDTPRDLTIAVEVDETAAPPYDTVVSARTDCSSRQSEIGCSDSGYSDRLTLLEVSGDVYVLVDGTYQFGGQVSGAYQITTTVRDIVAESAPCNAEDTTSRCALGTRCYAGSCTLDSPTLACETATELIAPGPIGVTVFAETFPHEGNHFSGSCAAEAAAVAPEHIFHIAVAAPSTLHATTDFDDTYLDTYLYLRRGSCDGEEVACHDDIDLVANNLRSELSVADLPTGDYYLFVDGSSSARSSGAYRLAVTLTPTAN